MARYRTGTRSKSSYWVMEYTRQREARKLKGQAGRLSPPCLKSWLLAGRAKVLVDNDSASERGIGLNDLTAGVELMDSSGISSAIANAGRSTVF